MSDVSSSLSASVGSSGAAATGVAPSKSRPVLSFVDTAQIEPMPQWQAQDALAGGTQELVGRIHELTEQLRNLPEPPVRPEAVDFAKLYFADTKFPSGPEKEALAARLLGVTEPPPV